MCDVIERTESLKWKSCGMHYTWITRNGPLCRTKEKDEEKRSKEPDGQTILKLEQEVNGLD
ncbi:hypothetical protein C0J52_06814 [Blattella germanica]|nr:hypothetical protein C0J52_06814 [Blattella germanica]